MNWTRRLLKEQTGPDQTRPGQLGERPTGTKGGTLESTASKAGESVTLTKAERPLMIRFATRCKRVYYGDFRKKAARRVQADDQSFEDKAAQLPPQALKK